MDVSLEGLQEYAKTFVAALPRSQGKSAFVVGLRGELGAGKTTFVQVVARELGVTEDITSPTFVIAQSYPISNHPIFQHLIHIDAYRLTPDEPDTIGFAAYAADPTNLLFVEWPENLPVSANFPVDAPVICFETVSPDLRRVMLSLPVSNDHRTRS